MPPVTLKLIHDDDNWVSWGPQRLCPLDLNENNKCPVSSHSRLVKRNRKSGHMQTGTERPGDSNYFPPPHLPAMPPPALQLCYAGIIKYRMSLFKAYTLTSCMQFNPNRCQTMPFIQQSSYSCFETQFQDCFQQLATIQVAQSGMHWH